MGNYQSSVVATTAAYNQHQQDHFRSRDRNNVSIFRNHSFEPRTTRRGSGRDFIPKWLKLSTSDQPRSTVTREVITSRVVPMEESITFVSTISPAPGRRHINRQVITTTRESPPSPSPQTIPIRRTFSDMPIQRALPQTFQPAPFLNRVPMPLDPQTALFLQQPPRVTEQRTREMLGPFESEIQRPFEREILINTDENLAILFGPSNKDCGFYFFNNGICPYEGKCNFRHCERALRTLSICPNWKTSRCKEWSACPQRHMTEEQIRKWTQKAQAQNQIYPRTAQANHISSPGSSNSQLPSFNFRQLQNEVRNTCLATKKSLEENVGVPWRKRDKGKKEKEIECCVCLRNLTEIKRNDEKLTSIECGHILCFECSKQIMESERTCPLCRQTLRLSPRVLYL